MPPELEPLDPFVPLDPPGLPELGAPDAEPPPLEVEPLPLLDVEPLPALDPSPPEDACDPASVSLVLSGKTEPVVPVPFEQPNDAARQMTESARTRESGGVMAGRAQQATYRPRGEEDTRGLLEFCGFTVWRTLHS
jgi:hypothetical protein